MYLTHVYDEKHTQPARQAQSRSGQLLLLLSLCLALSFSLALSLSLSLARSRSLSLTALPTYAAARAFCSAIPAANQSAIATAVTGIDKCIG